MTNGTNGWDTRAERCRAFIYAFTNCNIVKLKLRNPKALHSYIYLIWDLFFTDVPFLP